jgi:hypothetical protein
MPVYLCIIIWLVDMDDAVFFEQWIVPQHGSDLMVTRRKIRRQKLESCYTRQLSVLQRRLYGCSHHHYQLHRSRHFHQVVAAAIRNPQSHPKTYVCLIWMTRFPLHLQYSDLIISNASKHRSNIVSKPSCSHRSHNEANQSKLPSTTTKIHHVFNAW